VRGDKARTAVGNSNGNVDNGMNDDDDDMRANGAC